MNQISIDDFAKLEIKIGKILSAERIEGADKLLKIMLDIGTGTPHQILSGIALAYPDPSLVVGKLIPVLINLEPRTMKGEVSNGMMLCADNEGKPILLSPIEEVPPGSVVK